MKPWKRAHELRLDYDDFKAWISGQYIMMAVNAAWNGKADVYPKQPFGQMKDAQENPENHDYQLDALKFLQYCKAMDDEFDDLTKKK